MPFFVLSGSTNRRATMNPEKKNNAEDKPPVLKEEAIA
jgi:hypothetical protein